MKDSKFIVVQDEAVANRLITSGFKMVSHINNVYTFINQTPTHFNFDENDAKKMVYTNILTF